MYELPQHPTSQSTTSSLAVAAKIQLSDPALATRATDKRQRSNFGLGHAPALRPDGADASLHSKLAAAVAAGDREQVFVVAAQIVAANSTADPKPVHADDQLLPIREVARRLDISVRSITRHLARPNGDFPHPTYVGKLRKWEPADIEAYKALRRGKRR